MKHALFYIRNNSLEVETKDYCFQLPLQEVSKDDLAVLRNSRNSGFVLKKDDHFYYTDITKIKERVIIEEMNPHQCATCKRLSAAADKDGGCAKTRAFARCIENYNFIQIGYETFNTSSDVLIVNQCEHWKKATHYATQPIKKKQKVLLAQFLWEHIESYNDLLMMEKRA